MPNIPIGPRQWRNPRRANLELLRRNAERRRREDEASRLLTEVPGLRTLHMEITESGQSEVTPVVHYIRRFGLTNAPAVFLVPCTDPLCDGGGHDLTSEVLAGLRSHYLRIEGKDTCQGLSRDLHCTRELRFAAIATFE